MVWRKKKEMNDDEMFPRNIKPKDNTVTISIIPIIILVVAISLIAGITYYMFFDDPQEIMIDVGSGEVTISEYRAIKEKWKNNVDKMSCNNASEYLDRSWDAQSLDDEDMGYLIDRVNRCTGQV